MKIIMNKVIWKWNDNNENNVKWNNVMKWNNDNENNE